MKNFHIFMFIILLSVRVIVTNNTFTNHKKHENPIILFTTTSDDYPIGQYWPAPIFTAEHGYSIHASSVFIEPDIWYSNVIESLIELKDEQTNYIGYFVNYETEITVYLYGTQDPTSNDDENETE